MTSIDTVSKQPELGRTNSIAVRHCPTTPMLNRPRPRARPVQHRPYRRRRPIANAIDDTNCSFSSSPRKSALRRRMHIGCMNLQCALDGSELRGLAAREEGKTSQPMTYGALFAGCRGVSCHAEYRATSTPGPLTHRSWTGWRWWYETKAGADAKIELNASDVPCSGSSSRSSSSSLHLSCCSCLDGSTGPHPTLVITSTPSSCPCCPLLCLTPSTYMVILNGMETCLTWSYNRSAGCIHET